MILIGRGANTTTGSFDMNKDNAKDYLPLVQALAEGKTIQRNVNLGPLGSPKWEDSDDLCFDWPSLVYRIKPEPLVYERWVNVFQSYQFVYDTRKGADEAQKLYGSRIACIHIRQEYEEGEGL